jgi:hypothetical protein
MAAVAPWRIATPGTAGLIANGSICDFCWFPSGRVLTKSLLNFSALHPPFGLTPMTRSANFYSKFTALYRCPQGLARTAVRINICKNKKMTGMRSGSHDHSRSIMVMVASTDNKYIYAS